MLVGSAADEKAKELGLEVVANSYFSTPFRKAYWDRVSRSEQRDLGSEMGTVGAIVLDSHGHLAAGGSTGGPTGKIDGRVGDTAIFGAGLYADARLSVLWYVPGLCPSRRKSISNMLTCLQQRCRRPNLQAASSCQCRQVSRIR